MISLIPQLKGEKRDGTSASDPYVAFRRRTEKMQTRKVNIVLERFSFECRKVIGFALSTRCDWLKRFAPPFHPIRSKTKANCDALARFSRALRQPHVITSSFDWFNVLSVSYVIGQSNYFGFGFTTLKRKPLYYVNTNEIPSELSCKNLLSSHVKISPLL